MEKRKTRSSAYQWILVEKAFSHDMMESFADDDGMHKKLNPFEYNEDVLLLEDQLKERFWEIIEEHLTERQKEIVNLLKQGKTQQETASLLQINQSSITKSLHGNSEYSSSINGKSQKKTSYGGIVRKIRKIVESDTKVNELLEKISEIRNNRWG